MLKALAKASGKPMMVIKGSRIIKSVEVIEAVGPMHEAKQRHLDRHLDRHGRRWAPANLRLRPVGMTLPRTLSSV